MAVVDARPASGVGLGELAAARDRVQKLETAVQSQALVSAVERAVQVVGQSDLARKEIYIFTDLSRSAWPRDKAAELQSRILDAAGTAIYVIDVGAENPTNAGLGEVRLSAQVLSARSSLTIESELAAVGGADGDKRTVELYLLDENGLPQKRGEQTHPLRTDRGQQIDFRVASLEVGTHQGYLRLVGQDGLAPTTSGTSPWRSSRRGGFWSPRRSRPRATRCSSRRPWRRRSPASAARPASIAT